MINFCENKYDCRHIALCNYFGEKRREKIGFCKDLCDICNNYIKNNIKLKKTNVTNESIQLLETIIRLKEPTQNNILKKIVGYPQKFEKRNKKSEFKNNIEWKTYKTKYKR